RGDRRSAIHRVRRGREPAARAEGHSGVVLQRRLTMTDVPVRAPSATPIDDAVIPFEVAPLDLRGRLIKLGPTLDELLAKHDYPAPVSRLLGEAIVLTILLGSSLKFDGRFSLQTQSDGAVSLLVVDFRSPDRLRAYARFDAARVTDDQS